MKAEAQNRIASQLGATLEQKKSGWVARVEEGGMPINGYGPTPALALGELLAQIVSVSPQLLVAAFEGGGA